VFPPVASGKNVRAGRRAGVDLGLCKRYLGRGSYPAATVVVTQPNQWSMLFLDRQPFEEGPMNRICFRNFGFSAGIISTQTFLP
jgi:hypothetical protein